MGERLYFFELGEMILIEGIQAVDIIGERGGHQVEVKDLRSLNFIVFLKVEAPIENIPSGIYLENISGVYINS